MADSSGSGRLLLRLENCTDPAYLPGGKGCIKPKYTENDTVKKSYSPLFTVESRRDPVLPRSPSVPAFVCFCGAERRPDSNQSTKRTLPSVKKDAVLTVLRPDGTKAELFYSGPGNSILLSRAQETEDGRIIFAESDSENQYQVQIGFSKL